MSYFDRLDFPPKMDVVSLFDTAGKELSISSGGAREVSFNSSYSCSMQKFLTSKALQLLGGAVAFLSFIFHCTTFFFLGKGPKGPSFPLCDLMRHLAKQVYR